MAWYAVATAFFYMYFAAFIALAYGTANALIGIGLTVIAYSLINTVILAWRRQATASPWRSSRAACSASSAPRSPR